MKLDATTLTRLSLFNSLVLGLNLVGLVVLVMRDPAPTAPAAATSTGAATSSGADGGTKLGAANTAGGALGSDTPTALGPSSTGTASDPVQGFLDVTVSSLNEASSDLGVQVQLPDDAAVTACVDSGEASSVPCLQVFALLETAHAAVGMPMPKMPEITAPVIREPVIRGPVFEEGEPGGAPGAPGQGQAPATAGGNEILALYFDSLQARLAGAAEAAGDDPAKVLPDPDAVANAIKSGDPRSEQSAAVVDQLRTEYGRYGLRFTEPFVDGTGAADAVEAAPAPVAGQSELLGSYFTHMVQRMERSAEDQGKDVSGYVPDAADLAAAAATGSVDSDETQRILRGLREGYRILDLKFMEPPL